MYLNKLTASEYQWLFNKPFSIKIENFHYFEDFSLILKLLEPKNDNLIVDVGCGTGWISEWLSRCGVEVVGIDISKAVINVASNRLKLQYRDDYLHKLKLHFLVQDVEYLGFRENSFDAVLFYDALNHIPDWKLAIRNAHKVLKKNGKAVFIEPSRNLHGTEVMKRFGNLERGIHPFNIRNYCRSIGFSKITVRIPLSNSPYFIKHTHLKKVYEFFKTQKIASIPLIDYFWGPMRTLLLHLLLEHRSIVVATK